MNLTILGTGNATVVERYNTCFAFTEGERHFLVDTGGGNRILKVLKDGGISLEGIHDIFITHEHIDHLLGVVWLIRIIGQRMNQGKYLGQLHIYGHHGVLEVITTIVNLTIQKDVIKLLGERIMLDPVESGEKREILNCDVTFFDIGSTKMRQFGFSLVTQAGKKITCCGDEPYNECERSYVLGSDWLMHEAFCLYGETEKFKPYEKHHSTVREACMLGRELGVPNLILYHTEETHGKRRKELYEKEGREYYSGNLFVPEDLDKFKIS